MTWQNHSCRNRESAQGLPCNDKFQLRDETKSLDPDFPKQPERHFSERSEDLKRCEPTADAKTQSSFYLSPRGWRRILTLDALDRWRCAAFRDFPLLWRQVACEKPLLGRLISVRARRNRSWILAPAFSPAVFKSARRGDVVSFIILVTYLMTGRNMIHGAGRAAEQRPPSDAEKRTVPTKYE